MASGSSFEFDGLMKLTADLGAAPLKVIPFARKAVEVTARHIKDDWQKFSAESNVDGSLSGYPRSIDYDMMLDTDGSIGAEIGPNLGKFQGSFGFVEEANGGVRSLPRNDGRDAAKLNTKDFEKGLLQAGEDALK